jgi:hypothetical protein
LRERARFELVAWNAVTKKAKHMSPLLVGLTIAIEPGFCVLIA